jgi:hypothetical protein
MIQELLIADDGVFPGNRMLQHKRTEFGLPQ